MELISDPPPICNDEVDALIDLLVHIESANATMSSEPEPQTLPLETSDQVERSGSPETDEDAKFGHSGSSTTSSGTATSGHHALPEEPRHQCDPITPTIIGASAKVGNAGTLPPFPPETEADPEDVMGPRATPSDSIGQTTVSTAQNGSATEVSEVVSGASGKVPQQPVEAEAVPVTTLAVTVAPPATAEIAPMGATSQANVSPAAALSTGSAAEAPTHPWSCRECGKTNRAQAKFCGGCGRPKALVGDAPPLFPTFRDLLDRNMELIRLIMRHCGNLPRSWNLGFGSVLLVLASIGF